jgi:hypothetical protein
MRDKRRMTLNWRRSRDRHIASRVFIVDRLGDAQGSRWLHAALRAALARTATSTLTAVLVRLHRQAAVVAQDPYVLAWPYAWHLSSLGMIAR